MNRRPYATLIVVLILLTLALWVNLSKDISIINPFNSQPIFTRNVETRLGLDLRGGLQALLEVPEGVRGDRGVRLSTPRLCRALVRYPAGEGLKNPRAIPGSCLRWYW